MATTTTDVLVVGAGPTGLTMANLLAHSGVSVRILDKKAGPTRESRAVVVHAKTLELLDRLDLAARAVEGGGHFADAQLFLQGKTAGHLAFMARDNAAPTPYPFALIYGQDQTEHLLIQNLAEAGVQVEWNTELVNLEQISSGAHAYVRTNGSDEEVIEASWVVGADSAHSPVRRALALSFQGRNYTQTLFVADLDLEWDLEPGQGGMDLAQRGFFLFVPMHGEKRYRLFGTLPSEMSDREALTSDDAQSILDTQSGLHVTVLRTRWISVYHTHLRMAERFRVGRVFLAGDAAHIHSPAGGQGMNTGIGDAYNLAWKLALVVKGQAHETLLDSYEAERIPFARAILNGSDEAFRLMTTTNPLMRRLRSLVMPLFFGLVSILPFLGRRAFWLVSQLWTSYRSSPSVAESGPVKRGPRAGDRAPYGIFEAGSDKGVGLFTRFRDLDHHLLLFEGSEQSSTEMNQRDVAENIQNIQTLLHTYSLPIHLDCIAAENRELYKLYGVSGEKGENEPSLFLVRPDGQLAYRGPAHDLDGLKSYLDKLFVQRVGQAQVEV